ncbi:DUF1963 domain-containing protein [Chlorogloeopsis fritschii PCC 9212]|uniref:DUF1963 domain-containing protein n=1 Tax=Chlorogloeopsis fritschii PCC 6912 TaxID=211165 RepID=A0A3S1APW5_CHLFR|nr:DUF1963 domain-containing protein [Chlorogloeopsis fritschii]RUR87009.1 hypothetical protein PCC6912_04520 [Chlorogloeopsis fritschii PCC 6912]
MHLKAKEQFKQKLSGVKRSAFKPITQPGDGDLTASKFAGKPWLNAGEKWPLCPNSNQPMQFFLQINLDELPQNAKNIFGTGILQLFYCTNVVEIKHDTGLFGKTIEECEKLKEYATKNLPLPQGIAGTVVDWEGDIGKIKFVVYKDCVSDYDGWSPFSPCQLVRIVQPNHQPTEYEIPEMEGLFPAKLIVGWKEVSDYPNWLEIDEFKIPLEKDEEDILDDILMEEFHQGGDKLAGWPDWVQVPEYPKCPICSQPMNQLVFQLESADNIPYTWGDAGVGYILQCPQHKEEVAFLWQCT